MKAHAAMHYDLGDSHPISKAVVRDLLLTNGRLDA